VEGFRDAAKRWHPFVYPLEEAHARLGEARTLIALGRPREGDAPLAIARELFQSLGAVTCLTEVEAVDHAIVSTAAELI
jgi:hypothetical protein